MIIGWVKPGTYTLGTDTMLHERESSSRWSQTFVRARQGEFVQVMSTAKVFGAKLMIPVLYSGRLYWIIVRSNSGHHAPVLRNIFRPVCEEG